MSPRIGPEAFVGGSARVGGSAVVGESARVTGSAVVAGDGIVEKRSDLLVIDGLGNCGTVSVHRTRTAPWHLILAGCWTGTGESVGS